jgi:hypothetical protein
MRCPLIYKQKASVFHPGVSFPYQYHSSWSFNRITLKLQN